MTYLPEVEYHWNETEKGNRCYEDGADHSKHNTQGDLPGKFICIGIIDATV